MTELTFKLEVPEGLEDKAGLVLKRLIKQIQEEVRFSLAREILEESELTEKQAIELGKEVNSAVSKRHL